MMNYCKHKMRGKNPAVIAGWIVLGIIGIIGLAILFGFGIMWLWNWLMPELFGLGTINYWQAVGLFVLAKVLLGGCGGGGSHKHCHNEKHSRKGKKRDFSKWEHYEQFWKEEGDQAYQDYIRRTEGESRIESKEE